MTAGWEQTPNALILSTLSDRALGTWVRLRQRQSAGGSLSADAMGGPGREARKSRLTAYRELVAAGLLHHVTVARGRDGMRTVSRVYDRPVSAEFARLDVLASESQNGTPISESHRPIGVPLSESQNGTPSSTKKQTNYISVRASASESQNGTPTAGDRPPLLPVVAVPDLPPDAVPIPDDFRERIAALEAERTRPAWAPDPPAARRGGPTRGRGNARLTARPGAG